MIGRGTNRHEESPDSAAAIPAGHMKMADAKTEKIRFPKEVGLLLPFLLVHVFNRTLLMSSQPFQHFGESAGREKKHSIGGKRSRKRESGGSGTARPQPGLASRPA
jgi:hypothetical protein